MSWFADSATTVTAIGAAVAAGAAWRSASSSSTAANDAREAVALTIAPSLMIEVGIEPGRDGRPERLVVMVLADLSWTATQLQVEIIDNAGRVRAEQRERLDPGPAWTIDLQGVPPAGRDRLENLRERIRTLAVSYSDARGIARYRTRLEVGEGPISGGMQLRLH